MVQNASSQKRKNRSRRNSAVTDHARLFPDCLGELFGDAPTLKSEDKKVYWNFLNEIVRCIKPADMIEWLMVKDVVDLSWEILRFRKLKITLIEIEREQINMGIEFDKKHPDKPYYDPWTQRTEVPDAREIELRKNKPLLDTETDSAELLWKHIDQYEHIERLLTSVELRRDRALREIEHHRAELARQLRQTDDEIVDAAFEQTAIAAE
jgi:hypothetical protein